MSAAYALVGDVIRVKEPLPVQNREGLRVELWPGYYTIVGRLDARLVLAQVGEDEDGDSVAYGEPFTVWAEALKTEMVGITYMKVKRWVRSNSGDHREPPLV